MPIERSIVLRSRLHTAEQRVIYRRMERDRVLIDHRGGVRDELLQSGKKSGIDILHEIGRRISAGSLQDVLDRIITLVLSEIECDSCFIYILEANELVLRASKNEHAELVGRLKLRVGEGITGWTAQHHEPVALPENASQDPRFTFFSELPEDRYEAFLSVPILSRGRVVGVINLQHRLPYHHTMREVKLVSTIGFLVGAEVELARLESQVSELAEQLGTRKLVERAKGILQRDLGLPEEEAYRTLQRQSRQMRKPMKDLAEAIVISEEVRRGNQQSTVRSAEAEKLS